MLDSETYAGAVRSGVRDAYSAGRVGPIPDEWRIVRLGDFIDRPEYGYTTSAAQQPLGPKFVRITDIQDGRIDWSSVPYCRCTDAVLTKYALRRGDLLVARIGATTGKTILIKEPPAAVFASYLIRLRPRPALLPEFLSFFTSSQSYWDQIDAAKGGRLKQGVNIPVLTSLSLPLPPIPEQRAIAHVLRTIQRARDESGAVIAATGEFRKSLLHHLFRYGPANTDVAQKMVLQDREIGPIPEHWHLSRLGTICEFLQYGTSERCDRGGEGVPVLRIPNVIHGRIDLRDLKFASLPDSVAQSVRLHPGDLLFVRTNGRREYTGRSAVFRGELPEALFASYLIRARVQPEHALPDFIQHYASTETGQGYLSGKASYATGGRFNINTQIIKNVLVPLPPMAEQRRIVDILSGVEKKLRVEEDRQYSLGILFHALLHNLMTGEFRVKDPPPVEAVEVA